MLAKARLLADSLIAVRRQLHRHPELGYREERTAALIGLQFDDLAIDYRSGVAKTGVVAELSRGRGPTVVLRADMDALPVTEATGLPFSSETPGLMHACGHDAHVAMVLGAARLLTGEEFRGTVRFVFQPAEENNYDDPDGFSGGQRMVAEGVLDGAAAAIALHQAPMLPTGTISLRAGPILAAADRFEIVVRGRAAHAGVNPEAGIDAVVIAAELVGLLQTVITRDTPASAPAVITVGTIEGGSSFNVVADRVTLAGTTRTLDDRIYRAILARIEAICDHLGRMHGTGITFTVHHAVPVTTNDDRVTDTARRAAARIFAPEAILAVPPVLGGEDFAFYGTRVPACLALLGSQRPGTPPGSLHSPEMNLDENALPFGAAFLAATALELLDDFGN